MVDEYSKECIKCGKKFESNERVMYHYAENEECMRVFWNEIVYRDEDKW